MVTSKELDVCFFTHAVPVLYNNDCLVCNITSRSSAEILTKVAAKSSTRGSRVIDG